MWFAVAAMALECGFVPPDREVSTVAPKGGSGPIAHDAFGDFATEETAHFALKWGPQANPTLEQIEGITAHLEESWAAQVDTLGWLPPPSTDAFKLNVYIGNTGGGIPEITFDGGYVWLDADNLPYIVLAPVVLDYYTNDTAPEQALTLIAHEFNHTLQIRLGVPDPADSFFWEATANFVVPYSTGLGADSTLSSWSIYLLNPHLSWTTHHDPLGEQTPRAGRQYQAAMFLYDLAENQTQGQEVVRDAWHSEMPQGAVAALDAELDGTLEDRFATFAVTHATGDHPLAELYAATAELWLPYLDWHDLSLTETAPSGGTDGWDRVPNRLRPESLAWNQLRWNSNITGTVRIEIEADPQGTEGSPSSLTTYVATASDPRSWQAFEGSIEVPVDPDTQLDVIVVSGTGESRERFGYDYRITPDGVEPSTPGNSSDDDTPRKSEFVLGCATAPTSFWFLGTLALPFIRRRPS